MAVYDDKFEEVFAEGLTFKPLPEHVAESDEEDSDDVGMFVYWHAGVLTSYRQQFSSKWDQLWTQHVFLKYLEVNFWIFRNY